MLDHLETMQEFAKVIRGEHSGWTGDRIANAELFLYRIGTDMPSDAGKLADDLRANAGDFSDNTGLSPDRVRWAANRLIEALDDEPRGTTPGCPNFAGNC